MAGTGSTALISAIALTVLGLTACSRQPPATAPTPPKAETPAAPAPYRPAISPTLAAVRARGELVCGVHPGLPGFAFRDAGGSWRGFDVDICRAVAAAALGDAGKVRFVVVDGGDRFGPLRRGEIDLLSRNTSETFARDAGLQVTFPVTAYYDGQGFLAPRALGLASAEELGNARICVQAGTASAGNLADWFRVRGLTYRPIVVANEAEARRSYEAEACDVFTADVSALAASRSLLANPGAHAILPDIISKEPLGPVVRRADPVWAEIVRWVVFATLLGEEHGVSSKNVDELRKTVADPEVRRLLGLEGDLGPLLGLKADWAYQVLAQVGAYDEVFRRNLGADSALDLDRGLNALWNAKRPGLLYAPPMR